MNNVLLKKKLKQYYLGDCVNLRKYKVILFCYYDYFSNVEFSMFKEYCLLNNIKFTVTNRVQSKYIFDRYNIALNYDSHNVA
jgi:hypothetical protein